MCDQEKLKIYYTNNVRSDSRFLEKHLPSPLDHVHHVDRLPITTLPDIVQVIVNDTSNAIDQSCMDMILDPCYDLPIVVHHKKTYTRGVVARITITTIRRKLNSKFPGLGLKIYNSTELATIICGELLGLRFPKEPLLVEASKWDATVLERHQVDRLLLESYYMLLIYSKAHSIERDFTKSSTIPPANTYVAVFPKTSQTMTPSAYGYICAKASKEFRDAPMDDNISNAANVLGSITQVIKPLMRLPEHGPNRTLSNTACTHSCVIVYKSMLRKVPASHNESTTPSSESRSGNAPDTSRDLQHYIDDLNTQIHTRSPLREPYNASKDATTIYTSRVLKDVFHLIDILKVPVKHTLAAELYSKF
ncbi:hypothetical protein MBANPS3_010619 [Mucor bainieri]